MPPKLPLPRLVSLIRAGNLASQRFAQKIGMHLTATIMRHGHPYWQYEIEHDSSE